MPNYNYSLLNTMAVEYNQLVNASLMNTAPPNVDCDSFNDLSSSLRSRERDEIDCQLEEIENEIIVLLSSFKKRKIETDGDKKSKRWGKRGKYNVSKLL